MKKEDKIARGFTNEINLHGIGDLLVSAEHNGDEFNVEIESAHDVRHHREDVYNNFSGYCEQYFSSQEWMEFLEGESVNFSSKYTDIVEEMDYDYYNTFLYNNLFVIQHDLEQAFQRYIDTHFEDVEDDEEEDALPTLEMFASDYHFSVKIKTTSVFPAEWLLLKFNEDRKLKYGKEAATYIAEYLETLIQQRNDSRNLIITDVRSDLGFINITSGMYSDKNLDGSLNSFIKTLYNSKDFDKLVKGGIFGPKLMKIVNKWNDMLYVKVLDSETWFDYKLDINDDFKKHTEQLYSKGIINQDVRREMILTEIRVNLEYVDVIKEDALYYEVYEAREKAKKNKK